MAGVTTIALLERRVDISRDLFSRYWRDVHGVMAARIEGFDAYVQNHVTPLADIGATAPEPFEGIAICDFPSAGDRMGLMSSSITPHIHRDEQNVFRRALLYNLDPGASVTRIAGSGTARLLVVIPAGVDADAVVASIERGSPAALRTHDLSGGDPAGWNDTDVDDGGKGRLFAMLIEAGFDDDAAAFAAAKKAAEVGDVAAYRVDQRHIMVEHGRITTIGLRGLSATNTIAEAQAVNQLDEAVIHAVYGR